MNFLRFEYACFSQLHRFAYKQIRLLVFKYNKLFTIYLSIDAKNQKEKFEFEFWATIYLNHFTMTFPPTPNVKGVTFDQIQLVHSYRLSTVFEVTILPAQFR